jgi:hypothetical protein
LPGTLNAALALFNQLLQKVDALNATCPSSNFNTVLNRLSLSTWSAPAEVFQVPIAEQAAFRFSSALLILDDIIAATILQEQPRLYSYHRSLLYTPTSSEAVINLEETVGCQNWALLYIGEIAAPDAWKQQSHRAGSLDVMELVRRATAIKILVEEHMLQLDTDPINILNERPGLIRHVHIRLWAAGQNAREPDQPGDPRLGTRSTPISLRSRLGMATRQF